MGTSLHVQNRANRMRTFRESYGRKGMTAQALNRGLLGKRGCALRDPKASEYGNLYRVQNDGKDGRCSKHPSDQQCR